MSISPPTSILLLVTILGLLLPAPTAGEWTASTPQGMLVEDKARLGSTPPSCHNRCNACSPCVAVQVPTMLGKDQVRERGLGRKVATPMDGGGGSYGSVNFPYYKPLGWKCRCGGHYFNP